jgi:invasion protein IalB
VNSALASKLQITTLARFALSGILTVGISSAYAQQRTTAVYSDWTLSCAMGSGASGGKSCGLVQVQRVEGQTFPMGQIGVGRSEANGPFKLVIEIRSNAWIPTGVRLIVGSSAIPATFKWCMATRCAADADLTDDDVRNLRVQRQLGRIVYKNVSQADVSIPVSFNGFSEALDALQKE